MTFLLFLAILAMVVVFVTRPLWRTPGGSAQDHPGLGGSTTLADLEAAREAKYREIRDAELDHRTGKLSEADFQVIDSSLRAEAVEILRELDRSLHGEHVPAQEGPSRAANSAGTR